MHRSANGALVALLISSLGLWIAFGAFVLGIGGAR